MNVQRISNFINRSTRTQNLIKGINHNPAIFCATSSFILASLLRPSVMMALPSKDKKDKLYSMASSMSAGLVELGATVALFVPINKCIDKASKVLHDCKGTFFYENKLALRNYKSINNRIIKLLSLVPISMARFALIKPIVKTLFGKDKA